MYISIASQLLTYYRRHHLQFWFFVILALVSIAIRLIWLNQQAFTNDEGAYLYDAITIIQGRLPGGDVLTKTPVTALFFSASVFLTGGSLYAARAVTLIASLLTAIPLYFTTRSLANRRAAIIAVTIWLLGAGPIIFHTLGHTEALAALLTTTCLFFWLKATTKQSAKYYFLAALFFIVAFATRKTSLAILAPICLWWLLHSKPSTVITRVITPVLIAVAIILIPWLIIVYLLYGTAGLAQATGLEYSEIVFSHISGRLTQTWGGGLSWVTQVVTRSAAAQLILALLGLTSLISAIAKRAQLPVAWLGFIIAGLLATIASFVVSTQPGFTGSFLEFLWLLMAIIFLKLALTPGTKSSPPKDELKPLLVPTVWLFAVAALYSTWPVFLADYLADFFIPATLLGAVALSSLITRRLYTALATFTLLIAMSTANLINVYHYPWTGMFSKDAITDTAVILKQTVPPDEPIFTAAVIIPYISGHRALYDIAHPLWYRLTFATPNTSDIFMPDIEDVKNNVLEGHLQYAITEQLTNYTYMPSGTRFRTQFRDAWHAINAIPNNTGFRNNPIQIWRKNTTPK